MAPSDSREAATRPTRTGRSAWTRTSAGFRFTSACRICRKTARAMAATGLTELGTLPATPVSIVARHRCVPHRLAKKSTAVRSDWPDGTRALAPPEADAAGRDAGEGQGSNHDLQTRGIRG